MSVPPSSSTPPHQRLLARFPAEIQAAHESFLTHGDVDAADRVLLAVLRAHMPDQAKRAAQAELTDDCRLLEDLGFDSLAVAEVVFFLEDLYRVRIPQDQLMKMSRVGDLRSYLRGRLQGVPT